MSTKLRSAFTEHLPKLLCLIALAVGFAVAILVKPCTNSTEIDVGAAVSNTTMNTTSLCHSNETVEVHVPMDANRTEWSSEGWMCNGTYTPGRGTCGTRIAVAASDPTATQIGLEVLKRGGNIYDAAIAIQSVLALTEPQSSGLGGGAFAMIYNSSTKEVKFLDGREEAPAAYNPNAFCVNKECAQDPNCTCSKYQAEIAGGVSVGVPGVPYIMHLFESRGKLRRSELLEPAIALADNGFPISKKLYEQINLKAGSLALFNGTRQLYLKAPAYNQSIGNVGDLMINPDFAGTLRRVQRAGWMDFYDGDLARDIVAAATSSFAPTLQRASPMTLDDLKGYQAVWREPVSFTYRGKYKLYSSNYPSSGGTTLGLILQMLENISPEDYASPHFENLAFIQSFLSAQDIAFADRNSVMGDADFNDIPSLLRAGYAKERFQKFANAVRFSNASAGVPHHDNGTAHFSIVDAQGNVLSMTTTVESAFGCFVVVPSRGFLLNNQLTDFYSAAYSIASDGRRVLHSNAPEGGKKLRRTAIEGGNATLGGKRPMSSMSPTIVLDNLGRPVIAVGAAGGSTIIGTVANILVGIIDFDLPPERAIAARRMSGRSYNVVLEPSTTVKEAWAVYNASTPLFGDCPRLVKDSSLNSPPQYAALEVALCNMGYTVQRYNPIGQAQCITFEYDTDFVNMTAAGDERGNGKGLAE